MVRNVRSALAFLCCMIWGTEASAQTRWRVADLRWETSCGADRGAIEREGDTYVFRNSTNYCGELPPQRTEINTSEIPVTEPVTYLIETTVSFQGGSQDAFNMFQVHDGRRGCAPPLSIRWNDDNSIWFSSDYTRDQGEAGCVDNRALMDARYYGPTLLRDGTRYKLQVLLAFDGSGSFDVTVYVDGTSAITGRYQPLTDPSFVTWDNFYLKHGVVFLFDTAPFELRSEGFRVLEAIE